MLCHTQEYGKVFMIYENKNHVLTQIFGFCSFMVILSWQETCVQYWPFVGDSKVFGEFLIETQNEVEYPGFLERTLSITEKVSHDFHLTHRNVNFCTIR